MKYLKLFCLLLAGTYFLSTTAYAMDLFSIRTASTTPIDVESCSISVAAGDVLELSAEDLERRIGLENGSLQGITITSLPHSSQGAVYLDGVEIEAYDFLSRGDIDRLCYVPGDGAVGASITFVPQGSDAVTTSLAIQVLETPNLAPLVESMSLETVENVQVRGALSVYDPEGDPVQMQILQAPGRGTVVFEGTSFVYTPYPGSTGADAFVVCAVDSHFNYSPAATVEITVEANHNSFSYRDMNGNPSHYAAVKLQEKGIYTGITVGGQSFLHPGKQMTRGEFLILLLCAADLDNSVQPTVNTGLPNDASIPLWLKPYVKKGIEEGILASNQPFVHTEIPIRAEAVLMTDRVADIEDVKEYPLTSIPDQTAIPDWARPSYMDLAAYKMLDLHDGAANPQESLTNSYAIDLAWQLWKHCHR